MGCIETVAEVCKGRCDDQLKGLRMERIAIYPGSFDPVTNGHLDIVKRGLKIFDKIIVAILQNPAKKALFTVDERIEMLNFCLGDYKEIKIDTFDGLLVEYAETQGAQAIFQKRLKDLSSHYLF